MKSLLKIIKKITKTISIKTTQIKKKKPSKKKVKN
jgi:hypothetical protein